MRFTGFLGSCINSRSPAFLFCVAIANNAGLFVVFLHSVFKPDHGDTDSKKNKNKIFSSQTLASLLSTPSLFPLLLDVATRGSTFSKEYLIQRHHVQ
jgi:hypothetical protein